MKISAFVIFFTIVLTIYTLVNYYIFIRGWQAIPRGSSLRTGYLVIFIFLFASFIAGRILERVYLSVFSDILVWVGSFWLGAMLYFFLAIVLLDLARLINHFLPFFPGFLKSDYGRAKFMIALGTVLLVGIILFIGHINAAYPRIRNLELQISKSVPGFKGVRIAVASDIHLGTLVDKGQCDYLVEKIAQLSPDLVLFVGDIVDEDLGPVIREDIGATLRKIQAPLGVYAVTGNHEMYGGLEPACRYLEEHGIRMLRDTAIKIVDAFYLVGREDREVGRIFGRPRLSLDKLVGGLDRNLPIILMDHQPFRLEEVPANGVDLQLSGHTHHGQLWPFNFFTAMIYEVSSGYRRKGDAHIYISTGFGTWGPPIRLGNRPEILNLTLRFN